MSLPFVSRALLRGAANLPMEYAMPTSRCLATTILAVLMSSCASLHEPPSADVRQALAPTGTLRVGVSAGRPWSMLVDSASGEPRGVGYELGKALAARLGVAFEPVVFPGPGDFAQGLASGKADIVLTNATAARARVMDFSAPVLEIEQGFLVRAGFPVSAIAEVDRPGVRVGVGAGGSSESILARELKHAKLVGVQTVKSAIEMLLARELDVFASNKATLLEISGDLPGARILEGRYGVEHMALGIPKGREAGLAYVRRFAQEAGSDGLVRRAAERAGMPVRNHRPPE